MKKNRYDVLDTSNTYHSKIDTAPSSLPPPPATYFVNSKEDFSIDADDDVEPLCRFSSQQPFEGA